MTHRSGWRAAASVALALAAMLVGRTAVDAADETVQLLPRWKIGEKVGYDIVRTRRKSLPDKPVSETVSRSSAEIEVLSAGDDGFALAWTHGETTAETPGGAEDAVTKKLSDLFKGLRVVLEMDSSANLKGVRNWREVKETATKAVAVLCDELIAKGTAPEIVAKVRAQVAPQFAGKEQIERSCTHDAQRFFMVLGFEFKDGKPVEYEDALPNPFGGEPFPCKARYSLRSVDRKLGIATVDFTQTIPPEDAVRIMDKTLKDMAQRMGKPVPDAEGLKSFSIEDTAEFRVHLASGWIESLTHKRATKSGGASQEDVVTFTRKVDAAPAPK